mgnify:CR=1 FL=1
MNIIFSTLIVILIILLFSIFAAWLDKFGRKHKEEFIEKTIGNVSGFFTTYFDIAMGLYKAGPWYLVVYTKETSHPIWVSNNNIRSVHPDPKNRKIIIKQFNGEDMVIENVENYEMRAANKMDDYDM